MRKRSQGFTLIEMLLVFAVFATFAVVVTFRQDLFRDQIALDSFAADSVLLLQTTQALASGGSDLSTTASRGVSAQSGTGLVQFDDSTSGTLDAYDTNDVVRETLELPRTITLYEVCAREISENWECSTTDNLDIVFSRAQVAPVVTFDGSEYQEARIEYRQVSGSEAIQVVVNQNGVIYVQ